MTEHEQTLIRKMRRQGGASMSREDMIGLVACPRCTAAVGSACRKKKSEIRSVRRSIHAERMSLAQDALRVLLANNPKEATQ